MEEAVSGERKSWKLRYVEKVRGILRCGATLKGRSFPTGFVGTLEARHPAETKGAAFRMTTFCGSLSIFPNEFVLEKVLNHGL